jgi:DNA modification methylase
MFVQSFWVHKIDPKSKATLFYTLAALTYVASFVIGNVEQNAHTTFQMMLQTGMWWAGAILYVVGSFSIKRSLEWYYNTAEPIKLHLSSPMVFLFGTIYFQYYLSEIAYWKKTGTFRP